jgi:hypothetical protein
MFCPTMPTGPDLLAVTASVAACKKAQQFLR